MPQTARRHHFVPEFYLAGFTPSGKKDDLLFVIDKQEKYFWCTKPAGAAFETDFYSVKAEDIDEDGVEKALADFEGRVAPVLAGIHTSKQLPQGDDFIILMMFVAFMAVRTPRYRKTLSNFISQVGKHIMRLIIATPERWNAALNDMRSSGIELSENVSYEDMRKFTFEDNYKVDFERTWHVGVMLKSVETIMPYLVNRKWSLFIRPNPPWFICSDDPLVIVSNVPLPPPFGPGFGMKGTEVTLPLNKQMALSGRFEGDAKVVSAYPAVTAAINYRTAGFCTRFTYSPRKDFISMLPNGKIINAEGLLGKLKPKKQGKKH